MIREETLEILEWEKILSRLTTLCATEAGVHEVSTITFSTDVNLVSQRLEENKQMRLLITTDRPPDIRNLPLFDNELQEAKTGAILPVGTIVSVMKALRTTEHLRKYFHERKGKYHFLKRRAKNISDLSGLRSELEKRIDDDGEIKDSASPLITVLKKRIESARAKVVSTANSIMSNPHYKKHLQDRYVTVRNGRHTLPFKPQAKGFIRGILHDTSQSGQTIFFEPEELVHANNDLKSSESEFDAEIQKIILLMSEMIGASEDEVQRSIKEAALIDCIQARALFAEETGASEPQVTEDGTLDIIAGRNPLLLLGRKRVVPNSVHIGGKTRCIIVTGPNAGGKTVLIKTVSLLTLMTMAGLSIPASSDSKISVFPKIYIAMGDMQSVEKDLSTFSADILTLKKFYEEGDSRALILLDEVITGTDPKEGTALGQAYLRALVDKGATVFVTTHFDEIKFLPYDDERFTVASMGYSEADLSPTFQLVMGIPGRSMGIQIAEKIGFPDQIIEEAKRYLGTKEEKLNILIGELTELKEKEARLTEELTRKRTRLREQIQKGKQERSKLKSREKEIIGEARAKALKIIRDAEDEVEKIMGELRKDRKIEVVRKAKDVISRIKKETGQIELPPEVQKIISSTKPIRNVADLHPGQKVFVTTLGKDAYVESSGRGKDRVTVSLGPVKSTVSTADIRIYGKDGEGKVKKGARTTVSGKDGEQPLQRGEENTLDVRGLDSEEAVKEVDLFLDRATLTETPSVFIIHGHGTGTLKKVIRIHLGSSPYVTEFSPAPKEHGGDGTTVVTLK